MRNTFPASSMAMISGRKAILSQTQDQTSPRCSCRADPDGDDYIINGSKIWTTYAHHANRMFMLVRTRQFEGKKQQEGITFLLLDRVDYEGMEIRPIVGLDGFP